MGSKKSEPTAFILDVEMITNMSEATACLLDAMMGRESERSNDFLALWRWRPAGAPTQEPP